MQVYRAERLIDGSGAEPQQDVEIHVEDGVIQAVVPAGALPYPGDAVVYSARVTDGVGGAPVAGVNVSIDASPPIVTHTDGEGVFLVKIRRDRTSPDVRFRLRKDGFAPLERVVDVLDITGFVGLMALGGLAGSDHHGRNVVEAGHQRGSVRKIWSTCRSWTGSTRCSPAP